MKKGFTVIIKGGSKEDGKTKKTIKSINAQTVGADSIQLIVLEKGKRLSPWMVRGKWINVVQPGQSWTQDSFAFAQELILKFGANLSFLLADYDQDLPDEVRVASSALHWYQNNPGRYIISRRYLKQAVKIANADSVGEWKLGLTKLFLSQEIAVLSHKMHLQRKHIYEITDQYLQDELPRAKEELYQGASCTSSSLPGQVAWMIQLADVLKSNISIEPIIDWLTEQIKELDDYAIYNGAFSGALRRHAFEIKYGRDEIIRNSKERDGALYFHNLKMPKMDIEEQVS